MKVEKNITVKNIKEFHEEFIKEFEENDEMVLDLSDVSRVDLSFSQVILAAGRKARELKKVIRVKGLSPELKILFRLAGIKV